MSFKHFPIVTNMTNIDKYNPDTQKLFRIIDIF